MPVFEGYPTYLIFVIMAFFLWTIPWKAMALWKSARKGQVAWFVFFVLVNTVGIMEILYLKFISRDENEDMVLKSAADAGKNNDNSGYPLVFQSPQIDSDEYSQEEKAIEEGKTLEEDARELNSVLDPSSNPRIQRMQERMEQEELEEKETPKELI